MSSLLHLLEDAARSYMLGLASNAPLMSHAQWVFSSIAQVFATLTALAGIFGIFRQQLLRSNIERCRGTVIDGILAMLREGREEMSDSALQSLTTDSTCEEIAEMLRQSRDVVIRYAAPQASVSEVVERQATGKPLVFQNLTAVSVERALKRWRSLLAILRTVRYWTLIGLLAAALMTVFALSFLLLAPLLSVSQLLVLLVVVAIMAALSASVVVGAVLKIIGSIEKSPPYLNIGEPLVVKSAGDLIDRAKKRKEEDIEDAGSLHERR